MLVYVVYTLVESCWFHSGVFPPTPECGAWQYRQEADSPPLTGEIPLGVKSCAPNTSPVICWPRVIVLANSKAAQIHNVFLTALPLQPCFGNPQ